MSSNDQKLRTIENEVKKLELRITDEQRELDKIKLKKSELEKSETRYADNIAKFTSELARERASLAKVLAERDTESDKKD